jgi:predicted lipoprotein with Yx(FWY)xxD motif
MFPGRDANPTGDLRASRFVTILCFARHCRMGLGSAHPRGNARRFRTGPFRYLNRFAMREDAMKHLSTFGIAAAISFAALAFAPLASAEDYGRFKTADTSAGKVLVDDKGMTLYTYDKDEMGKSNCVDQCAVNWPPAMAMPDDKPVGDLTIITRPDGSMQWADGGKPLYTFVKDKAAGDVTGDKMKDVWHVVTVE